MPSKSPAQARLMKAVAHGWKPSRIKGPSRAVAREFVNADRKYSGGFAENRYWTGGLAAMNEINSGVPQTLNFQSGGEVQDPVVLDMGDFKDILAQGWYVSQGWTWDADTSTVHPPPPTDEPTIEAQSTTTTAPATTGIGTPYVGGWSGWGGYGDWSGYDWSDYATPEPEPAPVRDIPGAGTLEPITDFSDSGESTGSQWTPEQIAAWEAEQTAASRQSPYRDQLREHKARIAATLGTGNATGGRVAIDELRLAMGGRGGRRRAGRGRRGRRGGGGGTITPAPAPVRDIPGAAPQPGSTGSTGTGGGSGSITGAVFAAAKQLLGQSQWNPEQTAAWQAAKTATKRQSPHRDRLRAHKARAASALKPGPMPSTKIAPRPPVYGDKPEPGMAYIGGTPGFYAPGGPGYGGGQLSGGGYGYEGDPSQPGYDDRSYEEFAAAQRNTAPDITDEVLKARYEGRNANQGVIYTSSIAGAKGGYMNYQEGGATAPPAPPARRKPVGNLPPIPGHMEGQNPNKPGTSMYRHWENTFHVDPPVEEPESEPEPPPEEPGFFASLFGFDKAEAGKTRIERYEEQLKREAQGEARGGYMRGYQVGGLARVAPPVGGIPPWVEPAGYMEPQGYQFGGMASRLFSGRPQQSVSAYGQRAAPGRGGLAAMAGQQQRALAQRGGAGRWSPQQQQAWRGARGNPALRSAMGQQNRQRQALMNRAPQQAGRAGMMADAQRQQQALSQRAGMAGMQADYQAGQRALQPGGGGARDFLFEGQPQQPQSIADRLGGGRFGEQMRRARGQQSYQDVVNRGGGGINPRLPGGGRMYGSAPQPGMAYAGGTPGFYGPGGPGRGGQMIGGGGITGGARVPPNLAGSLQKQRMMNRPPSNVGGGVNRVGQQDQQGAMSRAMQRGTGRRPMSRRGGFPGRGMR